MHPHHIPEAERYRLAPRIYGMTHTHTQHTRPQFVQYRTGFRQAKTALRKLPRAATRASNAREWWMSPSFFGARCVGVGLDVGFVLPCLVRSITETLNFNDDHSKNQRISEPVSGSGFRSGQNCLSTGPCLIKLFSTRKRPVESIFLVQCCT